MDFKAYNTEYCILSSLLKMSSGNFRPWTTGMTKESTISFDDMYLPKAMIYPKIENEIFTNIVLSSFRPWTKKTHFKVLIDLTCLKGQKISNAIYGVLNRVLPKTNEKSILSWASSLQEILRIGNLRSFFESIESNCVIRIAFTSYFISVSTDSNWFHMPILYYY